MTASSSGWSRSPSTYGGPSPWPEPEQDDAAAPSSRSLREGLVGVVDELREVSHGIHPAILTEGGLRPALAKLARRSPLPVELEVRGGDRLPDPVEVCVYYVASEALTNAIKHARATYVVVDLEADETEVRLEVRDDGVGGADAHAGSGLIGLTDRLHALGGTDRGPQPGRARAPGSAWCIPLTGALPPDRRRLRSIGRGRTAHDRRRDRRRAEVDLGQEAPDGGAVEQRLHVLGARRWTPAPRPGDVAPVRGQAPRQVETADGAEVEVEQDHVRSLLTHLLDARRRGSTPRRRRPCPRARAGPAPSRGTARCRRRSPRSGPCLRACQARRRPALQVAAIRRRPSRPCERRAAAFVAAAKAAGVVSQG